MEAKEIELEGRKYKALFSDDIPAGAYIILGPPEGLCDKLELPEPFATKLHNILYERGLLTYGDVTKKPKDVIGALQEAIQLDSQCIVEEYFKFEKEEGET